MNEWIQSKWMNEWMMKNENITQKNIKTKKQMNLLTHYKQKKKAIGNYKE